MKKCLTMLVLAGMGISALSQPLPQDDVLRVLRKRKAQKQEWVRSGHSASSYYKHLREEQKKGAREFMERLRSLGKVQQKQDSTGVRNTPGSHGEQSSD